MIERQCVLNAIGSPSELYPHRIIQMDAPAAHVEIPSLQRNVRRRRNRLPLGRQMSSFQDWPPFLDGTRFVDRLVDSHKVLGVICEGAETLTKRC